MSNEISKSKILYYSILAFIGGIAVASYYSGLFFRNDVVCFALVVGSFLLLFFLGGEAKRKIYFFIMLFFCLGIWRYTLAVPEGYADQVQYYNGQAVSFTGLVIQEPEKSDLTQKVVLQVQDMKVKERNIKATGKILTSIANYPLVAYGDILSINCPELKAPEQFNGFYYDRYLARYNIYSLCYYPKFKIIEHEKGNYFYGRIIALKNKVRSIVNQSLNEPEASTARAVLLGDKKGIPDELKRSFSHSGISHLMAISGMHISLLTAILMFVLINIGLSRNKSFYISVVFLVLYIIFIGLPASAMRAGLMIVLVLYALKLGRLNRVANSLYLTAGILLLINPKLLRDDIGFQLSFLAVMGIIYIYPKLRIWTSLRTVKKENKIIKAIKEIILVTLAVQIMALPVLVINFSAFSLVAPLTNLLVVWLLPVLMVCLLIAVLISLIIPGASIVIFLPASLFIKYIIGVSNILESMPYAYFEFSYIWSGWGILYYFCFFYIWWLFKDSRRVAI